MQTHSQQRRSGRRARPDRAARVFACRASSLRRASLEALVRHRYFADYGARVVHFLPMLMGIRGASGHLIGVIGARPGHDDHQLYLEHYLDDRADVLLAQQVGCEVERSRIAEIGNLACSVPGGGRVLVATFSAYLEGMDVEWAVFTATRALRNSFDTLGVDMVDLGAADGRRVGHDEELWGSYYATEPRVTAARIADVSRLSQTNRRYAGRTELVRRAARRIALLQRAFEVAA